MTPEKHMCPDCFYCNKPWAKRWSLCFALLGLALVIIAGVLPPVINQQIQDGIRNQLILDSTSADGYAGWASSFDPSGDKETFSIYLYDIINPLEVLRGHKPFLVERGPYCYNENKIRFDVSFVNNTYVQYKEWEYYTFNPDCSNGREDDQITTLNVLFQVMKAQLYNNKLGRKALEDLFAKQAEEDILFTSSKTAYDIIWGGDGYPGLQSNVTSQDAAAAASGYTLIDSGQQNVANVQKLYAYEGSTMLHACLGLVCPFDKEPMWYTRAASQVPFASEGTQFAPFLTAGTPLAAFVDDTNTALNLTNLNNHVDTIKGIDMLLYVIAPTSMMNATQYPANAARDMYGPYGFLNVTRIEHSMPAFLTNPHFYNSGYDPAQHFRGDITNQDPHTHQTFVWVEPNLGKTLKATKRLQVSFQIAPVPMAVNDTWFAKLAPVFLPVAWFEEAGTISDSQADDFKSNIYWAQNFQWSVKWVCSVFGTIVLCLVVLWWWRNVCSASARANEAARSVPGNVQYTPKSAVAVAQGGLDQSESRYVRDMKQPASEAGGYRALGKEEDEEQPRSHPHHSGHQAHHRRERNED